MSELKDLELLVDTRTPLILIETVELGRVEDLLLRLSRRTGLPAWRWTLASGLQRIDEALAPQRTLVEPQKLLAHILALSAPGLFLLQDLHRYLQDAIVISQLREIAARHAAVPHTLAIAARTNRNSHATGRRQEFACGIFGTKALGGLGGVNIGAQLVGTALGGVATLVGLVRVGLANVEAQENARRDAQDSAGMRELKAMGFSDARLAQLAPRRRERELLALIQKTDPDAFVTLDAVNHAAGGYLSAARGDRRIQRGDQVLRRGVACRGGRGQGVQRA